MKRIITLTLLLSCMMLPAVQAQEAIVSQSIEASYEQRTPAWWQALETQLTSYQPVEAADEKWLQNVVYFAQNHNDKVDLRAALPTLLDVYRFDERPGARIMALSAIQVLGDERTMEQVARSVRTQEDPIVRRVSLAMLRTYHRLN